MTDGIRWAWALGREVGAPWHLDPASSHWSLRSNSDSDETVFLEDDEEIMQDSDQLATQPTPAHIARRRAFMRECQANPEALMRGCEEPLNKKIRTSEARPHTSVEKRLVFGGTSRVQPAPSSLDSDEKGTLRSELSSVHKAYKNIIRDKDEEIQTVKKNMIVMSALFLDDVDNLHKKICELHEDLGELRSEVDIFKTSEKEWIGRSLKLKFVLDEIKKIGALPTDHAEWVEPMVDAIIMPEVSINLRDEYIPTAQTDNIDWTDEEEEEEEGGIPDFIYCTNCGEMIGLPHATFEPLDCDCGVTHGHVVRLGQYEYPRATHEKSATTIQSAWRGYSVRRLRIREHAFVPRMAWNATAMYNYRPHSRAIMEKSATTIQKAWQNHQTWKKEQFSLMMAVVAAAPAEAFGEMPGIED
jgi:hypothetical protein